MLDLKLNEVDFYSGGIKSS